MIIARQFLVRIIDKRIDDLQRRSSLKGEFIALGILSETFLPEKMDRS